MSKLSSPYAGLPAVIYCRVSSTAQATADKASLDAQEQRLLSRAQELGVSIVYTRKDAESAAILDKRSGFQKVLADAKAGSHPLGSYSARTSPRCRRWARAAGTHTVPSPRRQVLHPVATGC